MFVCDVLDLQGLHAGRSAHLHGDEFQLQADLRVLGHAFLDQRRRPQALSAVQDGHRLDKTAQIQCLFQRCFASPDDHDVFIAEQRAVACGAIRNAAARKFRLTRDPQPPGPGARRQDNAPGLQDLGPACGIAVYVETELFFDLFQLIDAGAFPQLHLVKICQLFLDDLDPFKGIHPIDTGKILDQFRQQDLAADGLLLQDLRLEFGAARVKRGCQACGTCANDNHVIDHNAQPS